MRRPWLDHYPPEVPAHVNINAYASLPALLDETFRRHAERPAMECMGSRVSYGEVDELSRALGGWLASLGLSNAARVGVMMPNLPQYMVTIAAILRAGLVVVNINPLYTARELRHQLKDSGAEVIVVLENFANVLADVVEETAVRHVLLTSMGDLLGSWKGVAVNLVVRHLKKLVPEFRLPSSGGRTVTPLWAAISQGRRQRWTPVAVGPDDVAFLQYTGGTTGLSKGATLLHRNVVANVLQVEA